MTASSCFGSALSICFTTFSKCLSLASARMLRFTFAVGLPWELLDGAKNPVPTVGLGVGVGALGGLLRATAAPVLPAAAAVVAAFTAFTPCACADFITAAGPAVNALTRRDVRSAMDCRRGRGAGELLRGDSTPFSLAACARRRATTLKPPASILRRRTPSTVLRKRSNGWLPSPGGGVAVDTVAASTAAISSTCAFAPCSNSRLKCCTFRACTWRSLTSACTPNARSKWMSVREFCTQFIWNSSSDVITGGAAACCSASACLRDFRCSMLPRRVERWRGTMGLVPGSFFKLKCDG